jgi:hypothetical protein
MPDAVELGNLKCLNYRNDPRPAVKVSTKKMLKKSGRSDFQADTAGKTQFKSEDRS